LQGGKRWKPWNFRFLSIRSAQVGSKLDERGRRLWAAAEVQAAGHGALKVVSRITGLARSTINRGEDDLDEGPLPDGRCLTAAETPEAASSVEQKYA
jgi:hypothetical protein